MLRFREVHIFKYGKIIKFAILPLIEHKLSKLTKFANNQTKTMQKRIAGGRRGGGGKGVVLKFSWLTDQI